MKPYVVICKKTFQKAFVLAYSRYHAVQIARIQLNSSGSFSDHKVRLSKQYN